MSSEVKLSALEQYLGLTVYVARCYDVKRHKHGTEFFGSTDNVFTSKTDAAVFAKNEWERIGDDKHFMCVFETKVVENEFGDAEIKDEVMNYIWDSDIWDAIRF